MTHPSESNVIASKKKRGAPDTLGRDHHNEQKNKKKKNKFFDLATLVQKISRHDVEILNELAWFVGASQKFTETRESLDIVREFLQMCDCELDDLFTYIEILGDDQEALLQVIFVLDEIFARIQNDETIGSLRPKVVIQAQRLISRYGNVLAQSLSSQADPVIMKPILKLLTSLVFVGHEVADTLVQSLELSFLNSCFTRIKLKEQVSIRTCAQYFLIALLLVSKRNTLYRIVENKTLFPWAFAGLVHDRPSDLMSFLNVIKERIVDNKAISKSQKLSVLNKTTLTPVMSLLVWKGQLEWRGKEWNRVFLYEKKSKDRNPSDFIKGNELIPAPPSEQESVRSCAVSFLSAVFFNTKQGIVFRDPKMGLGDRNCNQLVTQIVTGCPQVFSEKHGAQFVADLLVALPDQIKYIVVERYFNFRSSKLSKTLYHFYAALSKVVRDLDFDDVFKRLQPTTPDQYIEIIQHFCLFSFIPSDISGQCLTSLYSLLNFVNEMVRKLITIMATLSHENRRLLLPIMKENLIKPAVLTELLGKDFSADDISTLTEYSSADISEFILKLLDTLSLLASPVLGFFTYNIGWNLLESVDQKVGSKLPAVKQSKIYLRLFEMILSFVPDFESELVETDMKPMRILFNLNAEASSDIDFQLEMIAHTIKILKKFVHLSDFDEELELWVATSIASENPEVNREYSMALCDALRDCIVNADKYKKLMKQCNVDDFSAEFSPISGHMASLDHTRFPLFTAVMREILHKQTAIEPYIKFLQTTNANRLDSHFAHYLNFLLKGEKPFIGNAQLNIDKFSSETAMKLEGAFVESMTGGHPKSLERAMVKLKFVDEDADNVTLLNQLVFMIRWCDTHKQELFVNSIASCLDNLAAVCDEKKLSRLSDFIVSEVINRRFAQQSCPHVTSMVLTIIRRTMKELKMDIGFDVMEFQGKSLKTVSSGVMEPSDFLDTFSDMSSAEDITVVAKVLTAKETKPFVTSPFKNLIKIIVLKRCNLPSEVVKQLVDLSIKREIPASDLNDFFERCPAHAACIDVGTVESLLESDAAMVALTILRSCPSLLKAFEKKLLMSGEIRGPGLIRSLELILLLVKANQEKPSKESMAFLTRTHFSTLKTFFATHDDGSYDDESLSRIVSLVEETLECLRNMVALFVKDYGKLLKLVLTVVEKPSPVALVVMDAVFEYGEFCEDSLIAVFKCLTKLGTSTSMQLVGKYILNVSRTLEKLPEESWKFSWLQENFPKNFKALLKLAYTGNGEVFEVLRILCSKMCAQGSSSISNLEIVEMVFGHSKFLSVFMGKDSPLKQELIGFLLAITQLDGRNVCKTPHAPIILSGYNASLSLSDQKLFHLMTLYEKNGANLAPFRPLVWGEAASTFYNVDKGTAGVSILGSATINQVLSQISPSRLARTIHNFQPNTLKLDPSCIVKVENGEDLYDPRFILMTIYHLLEQLTELQIIRLIEDKIPLLALVTLSADCNDLRALGYTLLSHLYSRMDRVRAHPLVMYMMAILDQLRNSIGSAGGKKLSSLIIGFLIRACDIVITEPYNVLYNQIVRTTLTYPAINLDRLPPLLHHFLSSSLTSKERRLWTETLVGSFAKTSQDFEILYDHGLLDKIMLFAQTPLCDNEELVNILGMLKAWIGRSNKFKRFTFLTLWLSDIINTSRLRPTVHEALIELLHALSTRLEKHVLRKKEASLPREFCLLHMQMLQILKVSGDVAVLEKLVSSFARSVRLLSQPEETECIDEIIVFMLMEVFVSIRSRESGSAAIKQLDVFQRWTPKLSAWNSSTNMDGLWLEVIEILFSHCAEETAWNVKTLEMLHRSLTTLRHLANNLHKNRLINDISISMVKCTNTAPLLVIELFHLLKVTLAALNTAAYKQAVDALENLDDENKAKGYVSLMQEAWLEIEKPRTASLMAP